MAIDVEAFRKAVIDDIESQGDRPRAAHMSPQGDIIATAIAASCMGILASYARHKALTAGDIEAALSAFVAKANMVEQAQPMGGTRFERVPGTEPESPKVDARKRKPKAVAA